MSDERLIWAGTVSSWRITARPGPDGTWIVRFCKVNDHRKLLDMSAAWLPSGEWDHRRWWPHGAAVPPALRQHAEAWLKDHPLLRESNG